MNAADKIMRAVLRDPRALAKTFRKQEAERSLSAFTKLTWRQLEPGQPLRWGWANDAIADHLQAVTEGKIRNLLINVPPGFSKSSLVDVFWPAWEWGPRDRSDLRIISWSYAEHITKRDNERMRALIRSPLYQRLWGDRVKFAGDQNEKLFFRTLRGGFKMASSIRGVGMGERADRLILDDPNSVDGADSEAEITYTTNWFGGTMPSRVRNANAAPEKVDGTIVQPSSTVIIMQRVGRKDVSGVILDQGLDFTHLLIEMEHEGVDHPARRTVGWRPSPIGYVDPRQGWVDKVDAERARIAAEAESREKERTATFRQVDDQAVADEAWWDAFGDVWLRIARDIATLADPVRFNRATVDEQKKRLRLKSGSNAVASQFRQWPHEGEGGLFKRAWFKFIDARDVPHGGRDDCRGWDLAASDSPMADATATVRLRMDYDGNLYVMSADAVRRAPGGVDDFIKETVVADGFDVIQSFPQDPGSAGKHLMNYFGRSLLQGYRFRSSPESKKKAKRAEPFASQAEHGNVYIVRGAWNDAYLDELCEFPHGLHDDQVDATSRAYDALLQSADTTEPVAPKLFTSDTY